MTTVRVGPDSVGCRQWGRGLRGINILGARLKIQKNHVFSVTSSGINFVLSIQCYFQLNTTETAHLHRECIM